MKNKKGIIVILIILLIVVAASTATIILNRRELSDSNNQQSENEKKNVNDLAENIKDVQIVKVESCGSTTFWLDSEGTVFGNCPLTYYQSKEILTNVKDIYLTENSDYIFSLENGEYYILGGDFICDKTIEHQ